MVFPLVLRKDDRWRIALGSKTHGGYRLLILMVCHRDISLYCFISMFVAQSCVRAIIFLMYLFLIEPAISPPSAFPFMFKQSHKPTNDIHFNLLCVQPCGSFVSTTAVSTPTMGLNLISVLIWFNQPRYDGGWEWKRIRVKRGHCWQSGWD